MKTKKTVKSFVALKEAMTVSVDDYVSEFSSQFMMGIEAIQRAAKIYATALLKHPTLAPEKFRQAFPTVTEFTWMKLEKIGNGDLNPRAMLLTDKVAEKISRLPIEKQDAILKDGVTGFQVVNPISRKSSVIPISSMTINQANLLIDSDAGRIRTVSEQMSIVNAERTVDTSTPTKMAKHKYRIVGNVLIINGVEIGKAELKNILREMDGAL